MKFKTFQGVGVALVAAALVVGTVAPANAAESDLASLNDTAVALSRVDQSLMLTPSGNAGLGTVDVEGGTLNLPTDPTAGVAVDANGTKLKIGLPEAGKAASGVELADGTVTYPATDFSTSVVASDDGVQFLTTIAGVSAPTRYEYAIDVPKGGTLVDAGNGMTAVVDKDGAPVSLVLPAWAKDARGVDVPTHFALENSKLVQYVDHTQAAVAYPVVADPKFVWQGVLPTVKLNRAETYNMRYASAPDKLARCAAILGFAGIAAAGPCALSIAVLSAKAGSIYASGKCLQVLIGPGILGGIPYKDSYCR